ncbi:MAG: glycoside hydrolase family 9 protein [Balneolales bacterium]
MKKYVLTLSCILLSIQTWAQEPIKVNQLGYYPEGEKVAVVPGGATGSFQVLDAQTNKVVYTGTLKSPQNWEHSGEEVALADFSDFSDTGSYKLMHPGAGSSYIFEIKDDVHHELAKSSIRALYYNRVSTGLESQYAGKWARMAGHPDDNVFVHASAASEERPEGYVISSPKGWYDAGDYNKYIVNSGISTYTLLAAYEHYPEYYGDLSLNIPESGNDVPDLLDEARWNIDWMLTMQDPNDGGVYHKLTTLNFEGVLMPDEAVNDRYVVMKTTSAALNFAAVMATSARTYAEYDPEFARECLKAAEYAWQWAVKNPEQLYRQPEDVQTGAYGDRSVDDEFDWAAAELYISTQNDDYWNARDFQETEFRTPSWSYVRPLAWISLAHHIWDLTEAADKDLIRSQIIGHGDMLKQGYQSSAYGISMGQSGRDFVWGSNGMAGNQSLMLIQAYRLTGDDSYMQAALSNLDYVLGRNPTGYSYVTGLGSFPPMNPHHRPSEADEANSEPVPGFVVGGPQNGHQDNCEVYPSDYPASSFLDDWCSYSTNEVTINWNAPWIYTSGAMEYYFKD